MVAYIYQPDKNAMQSGRSKTGKWVLKFEPSTPLFIDPLMGWVGSNDTTRQLSLTFPTQEAAIAYATSNHIPYALAKPNGRKLKPKSYADNFKYHQPR